MAECLQCLGDGIIDFRDDNAYMSEHLTEEEMVAFRQTDAWCNPVQQCEECEGTGVVSDARFAELVDVSARAVARFMRDMKRRCAT